MSEMNLVPYLDIPDQMFWSIVLMLCIFLIFLLTTKPKR
jgi:hypothetical protein